MAKAVAGLPGQPLDTADSEAATAAFGEALRDAELSRMFDTHEARALDNRRNLAKAIRLRGDPDEAMPRDRLAAAADSGEIPHVGKLIAGIQLCVRRPDCACRTG